MPVRYTFSGNLFRINLEGSHTPEDIIETFNAALDDPLLPSDARFLLDVRRFADMPIHYGLSRMGATVAEMRGADIEVFTSMDDAKSWLGVVAEESIE
ncbi:MAG: hypothetical protein KJ927_08245 [Candidatus Eisenbacteria bacterium]|nr:hypothetical protein [Candidatus Eisenbacteria bacterium]